jgi:endonuclease/exonuclease/phosphatase family metal-dependent hydrolase
MFVLTWNLFHGRAQPADNRDLFAPFAERLAAWEWDVALLQECPPWWPAALGAACGASARMALTSRNQLLGLRRPLSRRWPELLKSGGGGCNAILVRGGDIADHRIATLRRLPERRVVHAVRWEPAGLWIGNLHAQVHSDAHAFADAARAAESMREWAGDGPAILGGDANVREPRFPGFAHVGGRKVDHVMARGLRATGATEVLERGSLSDHAPLRVALTPSPA